MVLNQNTNQKKSYEDDYKSLYDQVDNEKYDAHEDNDEKEYRPDYEHESHYKEPKYEKPEPKKHSYKKKEWIRNAWTREERLL